MSNKLKYYVIFPLLVLSSTVLFFYVLHNVYNLFSYKVYLIAPETKILVSTDFTATILIKGDKNPTLIEVYIDDAITQKRMFEDYSITDLGKLKIINLSIDPLYLNNGTHRMSIILKGGFFQDDSKIETEFIYEKLNNDFSKTSEENINKVKEFFSTTVPDLIIGLNNARQYYVNSDWRKSEKYLEKKESVKNGNVDVVIKEKLLKLIDDIENRESLDEIDNKLNSLNLELYNKGYPITNLLFENRYQNGNTNSFMLSYQIIDSVLIDNEFSKSKIFIIKRIDGINISEQFLGIKLPNSPFSYILNDKLDLVFNRYSAMLGDDKRQSLNEIFRMSGKYVNDVKELEYLKAKFSEEISPVLKQNTLYSLLKKSNSYHEIRHINDFTSARRIAHSVPEVLEYFYGDYKNLKYAIDSSFSLEKEITQTLLKVNPEYSAYLYELSYSDGLRSVLLLSLFEKIINPDKEETSHHWAAKLIIYNLAKANGYNGENILKMHISGNEEKWYKLTRMLIDLPYKKLEKDASVLLLNDFN